MTADRVSLLLVTGKQQLSNRYVTPNLSIE